MARNTENRLAKLTNAQLAHVYNCVSERQVSKFSDHSTAVKRTLAALTAAGKDFTVDGATVTIMDLGSASEGDDRKITLLTDHNPKGTGTKGRRRFDLYRNGLTIGEFVRGVQGLKGCGSRREAIRQIAWDTAHGYIRVD